MNRLFILFLSFFLIQNPSLTAQETLSMQAGYAQDVFYSFANGEVGTVANDNWDLAFQISGFAASIRINSIKGVELRVIPSMGISDWATVDTIGMESWAQVYNTHKSWDAGAFNTGIDLTNPFDLGWGVYNQTTHIVNGDSLFLITLADQSIKKIRIDQLAGGIYTFTYADLDGSNEVVATLDKADFDGKTFGYYSFENDTTIDREPASDSWDLVFTRYITELAPGLNYGVTGVLSNPTIEIAELRGVDLAKISLADTTTANFTNDISTIGYDWKSFNMNMGAWVLADSLGYFVRALDGETYLINFTDWGGSTNGNVSFEISNVTTSIDLRSSFTSFKVFPNPNNGQFALVYELEKAESSTVEILDLSGRMILKKEMPSTIGSLQVKFNDLLLPKGMYLLSLKTQNSQIIEKLIIN